MKNEKNVIIVNDAVKTEENVTNFNPANNRLLTPLDFLKYCSDAISRIYNNAKLFLDRPEEDRIDILINRIHQLKMNKAISKINGIGVLKRQLKFEKKKIKKNRNNGTGIYHLFTPEVIFRIMKFNKMPIHGKMKDFGNKIGFVVYHLKNSKGNPYFDFETVIIVRWVCALFVQSNGEPLNEKTMPDYIAEGRNMKFSNFENGLF